MLRWFLKLVARELNSIASLSFFLVLALTMGAGAAWWEKGDAARYAAAPAAQAAQVAGTSTTEAYLPPGVDASAVPAGAQANGL